MGVKTAKAMKSIDTFRFTSPDRQIIEQLAALYGGTAKPWNEPKANPSSQFEVLSDARIIRVLLVPDSLSTWYESWTGGGCSRRCDGIEVETPQRMGDDYEMVTQPCLCDLEGALTCEPHTRLQVVLPDVAFLGVWRLESKGWNAAEELPGMFAMIVACSQQGRMVEAELSIEQRERMTPVGKKKFVVPRLAVRSTVVELAAGGGGTLSIGPVGAKELPTMTLPQLMAASEPEIDEAELIDDELLEIEALLRDDANNFGLDPDTYIAAIKAATPGQRDRWRACSTKVREGSIEPQAIAAGRVQWKVNS